MRWVTRPVLWFVQVTLSPRGAANRSRLVNRPPSLPTNVCTEPLTTTDVAVCQSAWTYGNTPLAVAPESGFGSQCEISSQVGDAAVPLSVRAPHRLPPA